MALSCRVRNCDPWLLRSVATRRERFHWVLCVLGGPVYDLSLAPPVSSGCRLWARDAARLPTAAGVESRRPRATPPHEHAHGVSAEHGCGGTACGIVVFWLPR